MSGFQLDDVFVERDFESHDLDGVIRQVKLYIGRPQLEQELRRWRCLRQIVGIGDEKVRPGYGVDALQSLWLSLRMARAELEVLGRREQKKLTWLNGTDLGLPTS